MMPCIKRFINEIVRPCAYPANGRITVSDLLLCHAY